YGNSLLAGLGFGGVVAAIAAVVIVVDPSLVAIHGEIVGCVLLLVPFSLTRQLLCGLLTGLREMRQFNVIRIAAELVLVASTAALYGCGVLSASAAVAALGGTHVLVCVLVTI